MAKSIEQVIGDYRTFFRQRREDLQNAGFKLEPLPVSHLAFRTETYSDYLAARSALEAHAVANVENIWRGRPISKILLEKPLRLDDDHETSLIELIPPLYLQEYDAAPQRADIVIGKGFDAFCARFGLQDYPLGLEHVGFVVGDGFDTFCARYRDHFSYAQDMGPHCQPHLVVFDSGYTVKFYRYSLQDVVMREGRAFDGFYHAPWLRQAAE